MRGTDSRPDDWFRRVERTHEENIMYVRTALLATAVSLAFVATPVVAQTFNGFENQDPAVTQSYAPYEGGGYNNNGWSNGIPVVGPVFGVLTAPFGVATGGWGQPSPGCHVDRDFNGRYLSVCGM
jgi:hypothetical protein